MQQREAASLTLWSLMLNSFFLDKHLNSALNPNVAITNNKYKCRTWSDNGVLILSATWVKARWLMTLSSSLSPLWKGHYCFVLSAISRLKNLKKEKNPLKNVYPLPIITSFRLTFIMAHEWWDVQCRWHSSWLCVCTTRSYPMNTMQSCKLANQMDSLFVIYWAVICLIYSVNCTNRACHVYVSKLTTIAEAHMVRYSERWRNWSGQNIINVPWNWAFYLYWIIYQQIISIVSWAVYGGLYTVRFGTHAACTTCTISTV